MTPTIQLLLLATFTFTCLTPGAEAIVCRVCVAIGPGAPCIPRSTCQVNTATHTCRAQFFMSDGQLQQKVLGCKHKASAACGTTNAEGIRSACCVDKNLCNENL